MGRQTAWGVAGVLLALAQGSPAADATTQAKPPLMAIRSNLTTECPQSNPSCEVPVQVVQDGTGCVANALYGTVIVHSTPAARRKITWVIIDRQNFKFDDAPGVDGVELLRNSSGGTPNFYFDSKGRDGADWKYKWKSTGQRTADVSDPAAPGFLVHVVSRRGGIRCTPVDPIIVNRD